MFLLQEITSICQYSSMVKHRHGKAAMRVRFSLLAYSTSKGFENTFTSVSHRMSSISFQKEVSFKFKVRIVGPL